MGTVPVDDREQLLAQDVAGCHFVPRSAPDSCDCQDADSLDDVDVPACRRAERSSKSQRISALACLEWCTQLKGPVPDSAPGGSRFTGWAARRLVAFARVSCGS